MFELLLAILAGILTIATPCVLLPLPILLGGSIGQQNKTRPLMIALGFVLSFTVLGLTLNLLIQNFGLSSNTLRNTAAIILALFGLFMLLPHLYEKLAIYFSGFINSANALGKKAGQGAVGGLVLGIIIGIVWAPCAGPILGSILTLVARSMDLGRASILLLAYAIGAGIPMLAVAYGGQAVTTKIKFFAKYSELIQRVFGVVIILLAIAIFFQYDTAIQAKLLDSIPTLTPKF